MNVKIYYRGFNRKLHQMNDVVGNNETVGEVLQAAEFILDEEGTLYSKPLLALIQGGKK